MERRNRALKALNRLRYIDSLDEQEKADAIVNWVQIYLLDSSIEEFNLELEDLKQLSELFYKNILFMKKYQKEIKSQLDSNKKIKGFLS